MKDLIGKQHRHLLWQDEIGEEFLLLKYAEVFEHGENTLGLHCWSFPRLAWLRKKGLILNERKTDDPLYVLTVEKRFLSDLIALGAHKQRPHLKGTWLKEREKLLAHKILPYRPVSLRTKE